MAVLIPFLQLNGIFVIAQMKAHLILVKTIKDTFATSDYLTIQFGAQILKMTKNRGIGPISNMDSVKKCELKSLATSDFCELQRKRLSQ